MYLIIKLQLKILFEHRQSERGNLTLHFILLLNYGPIKKSRYIVVKVEHYLLFIFSPKK